VTRISPLFLVLALAACSPAPEPVAAPVAEPRLLVHILYVDAAGSVYRYDTLATAREQRNWCEVRKERDETFTRYSFTLHREDPDRLWTSL
jgi:hypothetical protein